MKTCLKCVENKDLKCFGRDVHKKDGLNYYCKDCIKNRSIERKLKNPDYVKECNAKYRLKNKDKIKQKWKERYSENREKFLEIARKSYHKNKNKIAITRKNKRSSCDARKKENERQKEWRLENGDKYRDYVRKWQINNREKINAHAKVHRAVKNGTLIRSKTCELCGTDKGKMEGHHDDYSKPLDVKWLCRLCHGGKLSKL